MRSVPAWALGPLLLALACGEVPRSPWVLSDLPRVLAIRVDVAQPGPMSTGVGPVAPGRRRAEVLPGDVMQPQALAATVDGPLDLDATNAAWFLCGFDCLASWPSEVPSCESIEALEGPVCLAGRGAAPEIVVPGAVDAFTLRAWPNLALVTGLETAHDTEACIAAMTARRTESFEACGIAIRVIAYGPGWRLYEEQLAMVPDEQRDSVPQFPVPIDVVRMLPPNAAPELSHVSVYFDGFTRLERHDLSEPLRVRTGQTIAIEPDPDPVDQQLVIEPVPGVPLAYQGDFERIDLVFFASEEVGTPLSFLVPDKWVEVTMPDTPTSLTLWLIATDRRAGRSWNRLDLEVVGP